MLGYAPLHAYSGYSFLQSALSPVKLASLALKEGSPYLSLCDFGSLSGAPEIERLAKGRNLSCVHGMDVEIDGNRFSCFIETEEGYRNLLLLCLKQSEGSLDLPFLQSHCAGLTVILDGGHSFLYPRYQEDQETLATDLSRLSKGVPSFYLGIPYLPKEREFATFLRAFASVYPYPLVAFPHILYAKPEDAIALAILQAVENKSTLSEKKKTGDCYYLGSDEAKAYFTPEERQKSLEIAKKCAEFRFQKKRGGLLRFPLPEGTLPEEELRRLAYEGLSKKNPGFGEEYAKRLEYELAIIAKMGYADYFLIVADYVHYAKTHGVTVGPGRGSSAGSLVSYALDIVAPDPIKYGLLFERFLNPERSSMPDIDVDFSDIGRGKVIAYVQQKYGIDHVAHIMTMQTFLARQSLIDVGKVFGYPEHEIAMLKDTLPERSGASLGQNYRTNAKFRSLVDSDPYYKEIVSLAGKIEGLPRQSGLHPAGILLNDRPLEEAIPISVQEGVGYVEQFDFSDLQDQGFLKMDFLGLTNLSIIDDCLALIKKNHGVELSPYDIPYEDKAAVALIAEGKTAGLFQLESAGMNRAIREIKPRRFIDVAATIALYRPGPMDSIPTYARRSQGKESVRYPSPCLESVLRDSYGVIVYQEHVMQIATAYAGFTYGQADNFRRAISKKDAAKMASLKEDFLRGALSNGHPKDEAERIYASLFKFADYGFGKAHAVVYAILACQMAYLKLHYPQEFYAAVLDFGGGGGNKLPALLSEMKRAKVLLALPDINLAGSSFLPHDGKVMLPLTAVKGILGNLIHAALDEREMNGPYASFFDFALRLKKKGLNLPSLIRLIDAGCFDSFGIERPRLRMTAPAALDYADVKGGLGDGPSLIDFDIPLPSYVDADPDPLGDLLAEKEAVGFMISGSPLLLKEKEIAEKGLLSLSELETAGRNFGCAGVLKSVRTHLSKKGTKMAFLVVYDAEGEAEFTLFADAYDAAYPLLKEGSLLAIYGAKDDYRPGRYIARRVESL